MKDRFYVLMYGLITVVTVASYLTLGQTTDGSLFYASASLLFFVTASSFYTTHRCFVETRRQEAMMRFEEQFSESSRSDD